MTFRLSDEILAKWRLAGRRLDRAPKDKCSPKVRPSSNVSHFPHTLYFYLQSISLFRGRLRLPRSAGILGTGAYQTLVTKNNYAITAAGEHEIFRFSRITGTVIAPNTTAECSGSVSSLSLRDGRGARFWQGVSKTFHEARARESHGLAYPVPRKFLVGYPVTALTRSSAALSSPLAFRNNQRAVRATRVENAQVPSCFQD